MTAPHGSVASAGAARWAGAVLCLAVAAIHVVDQGGVPGAKDPFYMGVSYHVLEIAGLLAAGLLLSRLFRVGWFLAAAVALGPLLGYVLSRGPGLPDDPDDIGNWGEPLGVLSLVVEGLLLALSLVMLTRRRHGP
ncbi:hypothetical protein ABZ746_13840 [Streptomyces sp. NPDC020096]